jgi:hypothetical protein
LQDQTRWFINKNSWFLFFCRVVASSIGVERALSPGRRWRLGVGDFQFLLNPTWKDVQRDASKRLWTFFVKAKAKLLASHFASASYAASDHLAAQSHGHAAQRAHGAAQ